MDFKKLVKPVSTVLSLMMLSGAMVFLYGKYTHTPVLSSGSFIEIDGDVARINLPSSLVKSDADKHALSRFAEIIHLYEQEYHRKLSGVEIAALIEKGGIESVDPHTSILDSDAAQRRTEESVGQFGGIGIILKSNEKVVVNNVSGVQITEVMPSAPAAREGVLAGDVITHINGTSVAPMDAAQIVQLLRGRIQTVVTLTIWRPTQAASIEIKIVRDIITVSSVSSELKKDHGIGYVRISSFSMTAAEDVRKEIERMKTEHGAPLAGLIIDLRANPGGLLNVADALLDQFLVQSKYSPDGTSRTTLSVERRGNIDSIMMIGGAKDIVEDAPILVLINAHSASASEILAGVLKIYGRATIAGPSRTYGKGTMQTQFKLRSGGEVYLTTAQYLIGPQGCEHAVQGHGVEPDILLKPLPTDLELPKFEETLERALNPSNVSNETCRHHYSVSSAHKTAAYEMLKVMGLEPVNPPAQ